MYPYEPEDLCDTCWQPIRKSPRRNRDGEVVWIHIHNTNSTLCRNWMWPSPPGPHAPRQLPLPLRYSYA